MKLRIKSQYPKEDFVFYEKVYGLVNYTGKTVLDLGADVGSTADYFLQKGARVVHAVEADETRFKKLVGNIRIILDDPKMKRVKPMKATVGDHEIIAGWMYLLRPDVVKADLDMPGGQFFEIVFLELDSQILRIVPEWLIECHTRPNARALIRHFTLAGFQYKDNLWSPPNASVCYFVLPAPLVQP